MFSGKLHILIGSILHRIAAARPRFAATAIAFVLVSTNVLANLEGDQWLFRLDTQTYRFKREGNVRGTPLVCLPEIAQKLGLKFEYNPRDLEFLLINTKTSNSLRARSYSNNVILNLKKGKDRERLVVQLSRSPEFVGDKLCVPIEFGDRAIKPLFNSKIPDTPVYVTDERRLSSIKVIIDPGHGGNDIGASSHLHNEEQIVLNFAKDLKKALEKKGVGTLLTRDRSIFTTLSERARMANQSPAKLFLSIHVNAQDTDSNLSGFELYILSLVGDDAAGRAAVAREQQMIPNDLPEGFEKAAADLRAGANFESSLKWAETIRGAVKPFIPPSSSRPIRMAPFYVLYAAQMPAVLLELGYIKQQEDMSRILTPDSRSKIIESLAKSIAKKLQVESASP